MLSLKECALVAFIGIFVNLSLPKLLPYGPAIKNDFRPPFSEVDKTIQNLTLEKGKLKLIHERLQKGKECLLFGPETIIFHDDGSMYCLFSKYGKLLKLENLQPSENDPNTLLVDVKEIAQSVGAPLGGKFVPDSNILYFADATLGLCRIDVSSAHPTIEIVSSKVKLPDGTYSRLLYVDDATIATDGMVYFSDASDIPSERDPDLSYDVMYSYKLDFLRNKPSGRILSYNPVTAEVNVLADGIHFANGVTLSKDESVLYVSETSKFRVLKYHLQGKNKGKLEVALDTLVGHTDGCDCSRESGKCYIAIPSSVTALTKKIFQLPSNLEAFLRTLFLMIPKSLAPPTEPYTAFIEFEIDNDKEVISRVVQDPEGVDLRTINGVTENKGRLYLGSLHNNFIGVYTKLT
ncbi:hypothetical protein CTEN210_00375 [Chaetoceros tenuissimus]|uniref:Strictosidine synthase conserved region domain-containing protein n=1 Tax=Chaetoceros tenuissimus TaxID=426638 RepID=A0AAD3CDQ3_9STRA|nr:hypothetical protein CTEN210_00375 [Chaetoceros tenuissimus]